MEEEQQSEEYTKMTVSLPPDVYTSYMKLVELTNSTKEELFAKMLSWFIQSDEYLFPYYACYRGQDKDNLKLLITGYAEEKLEYLSQIGNSSKRNVSYTAIIVFMSQRQVIDLINVNPSSNRSAIKE